MINPVNIKIPRHHLMIAIEAMELRLLKLKPGKFQHVRHENAYFSLVDAYFSATGERWATEPKLIRRFPFLVKS